MRYFTFGSVDSRNFDAWVFEDNTHGTPKRAITLQDIPGRNGSLLIDQKRYANIDHEFECIIFEDFDNNLRGLLGGLLSQPGYSRFEDSEHPDEFYLAVYKDDIKVTSRDGAVGKFKLSFNRKPQRFLKTGEASTTLTATGSIENPTAFNSKPLLRVYGTGTLTIGDDTITISQAATYTDIDCDMMEAYKGTTSKNEYVSVSSLDFPVLRPGVNGITLGTGITKVIITPRWWRL